MGGQARPAGRRSSLRPSVVHCSETATVARLMMILILHAQEKQNPLLRLVVFNLKNNVVCLLVAWCRVDVEVEDVPRSLPVASVASSLGGVSGQQWK